MFLGGWALVICPRPPPKVGLGALYWTWLNALTQSVRNCNRNLSVIGKSLCKLISTSAKRGVRKPESCGEQSPNEPGAGVVNCPVLLNHWIPTPCIGVFTIDGRPLSQLGRGPRE